MVPRRPQDLPRHRGMLKVPPTTLMIKSRHQRNPRRPTLRRIVHLRVANPPLRQLIQMRRLNLRSITSQVRVPHIIDHHHEDVRPRVGNSDVQSKGEQQSGKSNLHINHRYFPENASNVEIFQPFPRSIESNRNANIVGEAPTTSSTATSPSAPKPPPSNPSPVNASPPSSPANRKTEQRSPGLLAGPESA